MNSSLPRFFSLHLLFCAALTLLCACGRNRPPVPPGTVPQQSEVPAEDEKYGHEVLNSLTQQFPLDTDDGRINRVRDIVDRLTVAADAGTSPWHAHVLVGDEVKNAAATRGNFIFVWTGMLNTVQNDDELATILAHEMGHVLAGHTEPDPSQEVSKILAGITGMAAGIVVGSQGIYSPLADLAEIVVRSSIEAFFVNPISQEDELEADHIGLFLMSDAQYDPEKGIAFWERAQIDPDFSGPGLQFLSTHPSTEDRVTELRKYLDEAKSRYQASLQGKKHPAVSTYITKAEQPYAETIPESPAPAPPAPRDLPLASRELPESERWVVQEPEVIIYESPDTGSSVVATLSSHSVVTVREIHGRWLRIDAPHTGYVRSSLLSPE